MSSDCKPVLVIVCGGTIVMQPSRSGSLQIPDAHDVEVAIRGLVEEGRQLASFDTRVLMVVDSTDLSPGHWTVIADTIAECHDNYRAIIIVSGTNTLAYLSSALSFALQRLPLPVVVTGSQLPSSEPYSDARMNFVNSVRLSVLPVTGVFVVFGHRIILGCRAKKVSESQLNAFASFNSQDVGEIGIDIRVREVGELLGDPTAGFLAKTRFESNIACVTVLPGMSPKVLSSLIDSGCKGLILRSFGSGDIPQDLFPALEYARGAMVPVVNTTQCPGGATKMGINDVGRLALEYGVVQAFDMSMEAMSTKLMWLLGQHVPYSEIGKRMQTNLVGELDELRSSR